MTQPILDFFSIMEAGFSLNEDMIVKKQDMYFLVSDNLKKIMSESFLYAGIYLGKTRNQRLFPSFGLLRLIAEERANKVVVDTKTEWLFVCGRDVFQRGIMQTIGNVKKGKYVLVLNQNHECLGYGKVMNDLKKAAKDVAIRNISDIGDFLRRERPRS